ncbi:hypothetical protein SAMN05445504_3161 [Burkholderia sp. CF099]|nr:hypothetical protein SAMN05445504_3161 [Burkholderia sp. CF099]
MDHTISILVRTLNSPAQLALAEAIHAYHPGDIKSLSSPNHSAQGLDLGTAMLDALHAEEAYHSLMTSPAGGLLEAPPPHTGGLVTFLHQARGTLHELHGVVLIISPCNESTQLALKLIQSLCPTIVEPVKLHIIFVDCPPGESPKVVFKDVYQHLDEQEIATEEQPVLAAARAFENMQAHKLSLASVLHSGGLELEKEFAEARMQQVTDKKLRVLARRVMAARAIAAMTTDFQRAYDSLGLKRLNSEEWHIRHALKSRKPIVSGA